MEAQPAQHNIKEDPTRVTRTFRPHADGAKGFLREWGDKLVAVRYREGAKEKAT